MIVLGIDPGVATIGFGVVRAERQKNTLVQYGVITTPPGIPLSSRLLQISDDMEELIRTFHPDEMAGGGAVLHQKHHHRHRGGPRPGGHPPLGGAAGGPRL